METMGKPLNPKLYQLKPKTSIVEPRKLEHGFRRISAGIPYALL